MKFIKVKATNTENQKEIEIYLSTNAIIAVGDNGSVFLKEDQLNVLNGNLIIGLITYSDIRLESFDDLEKLLE